MVWPKVKQGLPVTSSMSFYESMLMRAVRNPTVLALMIIASSLFGCATPKGDTAMDKRASVNEMRADGLAIFNQKVPSMRGQLEHAAGYGVFSGFSTHSIIVATGNGYGVIHDNQTGQDTYMRALKLGGGLGAGIEDVYAIVVFTDPTVMRDMMQNGWGVTGKVKAAAKLNDVGEVGDSGAVVITLPGMSIYRFTKNGAMVGGAIEGTKVWPDKELN